MNNKIVIGILGVPSYDDENYPIIALYNDYKDVVIKKGAIPFMITPVTNIDYNKFSLDEIPALTNEEKSIYNYMIDMCDGIIIPGGYRIYNFDEYIVKKALDNNMPILGICRGMQMLANIDNGYNCLEKINEDNSHCVREQKYVHNINIYDNTSLKEIIGSSNIKVNSRHRYAITKVNNFIISSTSEDGVIESIESKDKTFVIGVQWHPEKLIDIDEPSNKLFDRFIEECKIYKKKF